MGSSRLFAGDQELSGQGCEVNMYTSYLNAHLSRVLERLRKAGDAPVNLNS